MNSWHCHGCSLPQAPGPGLLCDDCDEKTNTEMIVSEEDFDRFEAEIDEEAPVELTEHQKVLADALLLAAAGSGVLVEGLSDEQRLEAMELIVMAAPKHLKDDFERCCAYFIYRDILMQASGSGSLELILEAQNMINRMLDD